MNWNASVPIRNKHKISQEKTMTFFYAIVFLFNPIQKKDTSSSFFNFLFFLEKYRFFVIEIANKIV